MRLVEMFKEGRKTCVQCAEKRRRQKLNNYKYIIIIIRINIIELYRTPDKRLSKQRKSKREQTKILPEK